MGSGSHEALTPPAARREGAASEETNPPDASAAPPSAQSPAPGILDRWICGYVNPFIARVKRRPLFQKVVIVNTTLIIVGAIAGYYLEQKYFAGGEAGLVGLFFLSGISLSILINYLMVKMAFHPLDDVSDAIKAIQAGHRGIRVPEVTDDPQIEDLSRSINQMIDSMETARKRAAASVIKAQEEERRRIARELHDETSQSLTGLIIGIKMVEETVPDSLVDLRERLLSIKDLAHQTLNEVHTMAVRLRPSILDDLGLAAALRSYGKEFSENTGIQVDMQLLALAERLSSELETVMYRVVQEALTNVARHSEASNCKVTLRRRENCVQGIIEDNGRGFDPNRAMTSDEKGRGLGLHGMKERIELVGGNLEFESHPGKGTSIFIEVPLKSKEGIW